MLSFALALILLFIFLLSNDFEAADEHFGLVGRSIV